ncbi:hypothetical protein CYMTET_32410 [Cymbomonas tetramitiformis]|uniref:Uncharacterized protein n=1 Tax=Cymbomonas tetramitiformis TaxID=36881 RepID=A0AAE0FEU2_9CHLO|nr:hypothetical protein CYMTET_32406 [Cymbomonas tetramitiformis]KAK3258551.1 hypothetical protein CYMTET_32410 [Cymbomonas tetramitiformis]
MPPRAQYTPPEPQDVINTRARLQSHAALLVSNAETYQRIVESTRAALLAFAQDMDSNPQSPAEAARQLAAALEGNSRVVGTLTDAVSGVLSMDRFNPSAAIPLASQAPAPAQRPAPRPAPSPRSASSPRSTTSTPRAPSFGAPRDDLD